MAIRNEDIIALIRHIVQTDATTHTPLSGRTLTAEIAGRVFGPSLVDADAQTVERPCLIIDPVSGSAEYGAGGSVAEVQFNLYAYSDVGAGHAMALYDAAFAVLNGARLYDSSGVISAAGVARETLRPAHGHNDTMKSWFARGTWMLQAAG